MLSRDPLQRDSFDVFLYVGLSQDGISAALGVSATVTSGAATVPLPRYDLNRMKSNPIRPGWGSSIEDRVSSWTSKVTVFGDFERGQTARNRAHIQATRSATMSADSNLAPVT